GRALNSCRHELKLRPSGHRVARLYQACVGPLVQPVEPRFAAIRSFTKGLAPGRVQAVELTPALAPAPQTAAKSATFRTHDRTPVPARPVPPLVPRPRPGSARPRRSPRGDPRPHRLLPRGRGSAG